MIRILAVVAGFLLWWSGLAQAIPITGLTGLDQADEVADEHGQQGRDNARLHHTDFSAQNRSLTTQLVGLTPSTVPGAAINSNSPTTVPGAQNGSFTTQLVGQTHSMIQGVTLASPTAVPGDDPPQTIPEPTSLLLLGSGLIGLWFTGLRKS